MMARGTALCPEAAAEDEGRPAALEADGEEDWAWDLGAEAGDALDMVSF